jgi:hypothetical protein
MIIGQLFINSKDYIYLIGFHANPHKLADEKQKFAEILD